MKYLFAGCYLAGLKWAGRRWRLHFIASKFWDASVFKKCECGSRQ